MKQLLLFEEPIEIIQERKIESLKESLDKMRKSLHAKNGELQKKYDNLERELEFLKAHICKGNLLL
jgi:ABC-type phosphate transport system auxiliary subunit